MNGHYGVAVFVISNTLSSLPYIFLMALVSGSIVYVMVQLHHGIEHYIYFILCLFAELACADSLMMAVATICPTFLVGILVGSCIQGIYMLVGGFFRLPKDLPRAVWHYPVSYLGFHMYGLQVKKLSNFTFTTSCSGVCFLSISMQNSKQQIKDSSCPYMSAGDVQE
jgi:hypothetical protein